MPQGPKPAAVISSAALSFSTRSIAKTLLSDKLTLDTWEVKGKWAIMRVDLSVSMKNNYITTKGSKLLFQVSQPAWMWSQVVLMSHLMVFPWVTNTP